MDALHLHAKPSRRLAHWHIIAPILLTSFPKGPNLIFADQIAAKSDGILNFCLPQETLVPTKSSVIKMASMRSKLIYTQTPLRRNANLIWVRRRWFFPLISQASTPSMSITWQVCEENYDSWLHFRECTSVQTAKEKRRHFALFRIYWQCVRSCPWHETLCDFFFRWRVSCGVRWRWQLFVRTFRYVEYNRCFVQLHSATLNSALHSDHR